MQMHQNHPAVRAALERAAQVGSRATTIRGLIQVIRRHGLFQTELMLRSDWEQQVAQRRDSGLCHWLGELRAELLGAQPEHVLELVGVSDQYAELLGALAVGAWLRRVPLGAVVASVHDVARFVLTEAGIRGRGMPIVIVWGDRAPVVQGHGHYYYRLPHGRSVRYQYSTLHVEVGWQWLLNRLRVITAVQPEGEFYRIGPMEWGLGMLGPGSGSRLPRIHLAVDATGQYYTLLWRKTHAVSMRLRNRELGTVEGAKCHLPELLVSSVDGRRALPCLVNRNPRGIGVGVATVLEIMLIASGLLPSSLTPGMKAAFQRTVARLASRMRGLPEFVAELISETAHLVVSNG